MFRICYWCQQLQIQLFISCSCVYTSLYQLNLNQFTQYVRRILHQSVQIYSLSDFIRIVLDLHWLQQIKLCFIDFTQQFITNVYFFYQTFILYIQNANVHAIFISLFSLKKSCSPLQQRVIIQILLQQSNTWFAFEFLCTFYLHVSRHELLYICQHTLNWRFCY